MMIAADVIKKERLRSVMNCNTYRPVEEQVIYREKIKKDIEAGKLDVPIFICRKRPANNKEGCHCQAQCKSAISGSERMFY